MIEVKRQISAYNHTSYAGRRVEGVVVHYVGAVSTAKNNADYFCGGNRDASAHYFVDREECWQVVEEKDAAWHCGGGPHSQGSGGSSWGYALRNANTVGIEMCCEVIDGRCCVPWETVQRTGELVRDLVARHGIDPAAVCRHYDITGKDCPAWVQMPDGRARRGTDDGVWRQVWCELVGGNGSSGAPQDHGSPEDSTDFEGGTYRCQVDYLRVRTGPGLGCEEVAHYGRGQTVELDSEYVVADGYVWGTYVSYSGYRRWIAVGPHTGSPDLERDFLVKV